MIKAGWPLALLLALAGVLAPQQARAQVEAALVATRTAVQPGRPIDVAIRMTHPPGWHSFWRNAGTGLPTRIQWHLPPGWQAGEIRWPVPHLVRDRDGNITGHGYEDQLYLPVTLTAPRALAEAGTVQLRATVRWLMCEKVCVPGRKEVVLALPVRRDGGEVDPQVRDGIGAMAFPEAPEGWTMAASEDGGRGLALHVAAPAGTLKDLHFFPDDRFVAYREPQTVASRGNRALVKLALDAEETRSADARLRGVLAYTDASGRYRGVNVDLGLVPAATAASMVRTDEIPVDPPADAAAAPALSVGLLLFALLGGLILNLMPCVFPVIGLKVLGFVAQSGNDRRTVTRHALVFSLGVVLSFWALAGVLAVLRAGGAELGWGFQLQSAPFVFALAALLLVFALNLSGVFEFGVRATAIGSRLHARGGIAGSFFSGMLATVVATPCSAPFLAPALGAALVLPVAQSFVVFTAIAIGLSLPYLVLSVRPRLIERLPRPGPWMETFKQLMAFPLYATVAFLVWVLAGQLDEGALLNALFALTLAALALWLYGRYGLPTRARRVRRLAGIGAVLLLAVALGWGWPKPAAPEDVSWEPWSAERVAALRAEGRPIYVDFTARWCATCQVNKKVVFASPELRAWFREARVATLKADWTNADPAITAELARWGRSAVPFNLAYPAGGADVEPRALPEVLTPDIVLRALQAPPER